MTEETLRKEDGFLFYGWDEVESFEYRMTQIVKAVVSDNRYYVKGKLVAFIEQDTSQDIILYTTEAYLIHAV